MSSPIQTRPRSSSGGSRSGTPQPIELWSSPWRHTGRIVALGGTTSRLAQGSPEDTGLPAVVGESLVGLGHAVCIVPLLDGATAVARSVQNLRGQPFHHGLLAPITRIADEPAQAQRGLAIPINFHRHLIVRAA